MSPDVVAIIVSSIAAFAAIGVAVMNNYSNRKGREQLAQIAADQALALLERKETAKVTQEIKVSMDGRLTELLETVRELKLKEGVEIGRAQVTGERAAAAAATMLRDDKVVDRIVERIGEAADKAAQTVPGQSTPVIPPAQVDVVSVSDGAAGQIVDAVTKAVQGGAKE